MTTRLVVDKTGAVVGLEALRIPAGFAAWRHAKYIGMVSNIAMTVLGFVDRLKGSIVALEKQAKPLRIRVRKGGGHSNSLYGVLQSSFFRDRLRTLVGGRGIENFRPTDDNRDGIDEDFETSKFLPQVGALFRLTSGVSLYGSYSET